MSDDSWIRSLSLILVVISVTEITFCVFLLVIMMDIVYIMTAHFSTGASLIAALVTLPSAIKIVSYDSEKSDSKRSYHWLLIIICLLLHILAIIITIICFTNVTHINGHLGDSMKKYKKNRAQKAIVDEIQIQLQCCGIHAYADWFKIDWTGSAIVLEKATDDCQNNISKRKGMVEESYLDEGVRWDTVPFSCCSIKSSEPCVNKDLEQLGTTTINESGCSKLLKNKALQIYVPELGMNVIIAIILFAIIWPFLVANRVKAAYTQISCPKFEKPAESRTDSILTITESSKIERRTSRKKCCQGKCKTKRQPSEKSKETVIIIDDISPTRSKRPECTTESSSVGQDNYTNTYASKSSETSGKSSGPRRIFNRIKYSSSESRRKPEIKIYSPDSSAESCTRPSCENVNSKPSSSRNNKSKCSAKKSRKKKSDKKSESMKSSKSTSKESRKRRQKRKMASKTSTDSDTVALWVNYAKYHSSHTAELKPTSHEELVLRKDFYGP